jgi:hypothetical protein
MVSACDSWLVHVEHIHSLHKLAFIIFVALYVKSFDVDFAYIYMSVSTVCFGFSLFNAQLNYLNIFKVRKAKFNFDPWSFLSFLFF